eukprot:TRINITY_DN69084_c0_g1_i1.p1 TRINITY_DN69084_c0_g1~~TRINITY_DN69084_c0_g1_i1.p1  ORF type:complete len:107 (+),score=1.28 TRINITY_DN69084_c0_g1_i1:28-321(+)
MNVTLRCLFCPNDVVVTSVRGQKSISFFLNAKHKLLDYRAVEICLYHVGNDENATTSQLLCTHGRVSREVAHSTGCVMSGAQVGKQFRDWGTHDVSR